MKFRSNLDALVTVQEAATQVTFRSITPAETLVFGLQEEHYSTCGQFGVAEISCGRGNGVLLCRDRHLIVMLFESNGCCTVNESYYIPEQPVPDSYRYYQQRGRRNPAGWCPMRQVPQHLLNDTDFAVRVPGTEGDASEAEADQWYMSSGYLRLSVSGRYPPELLAEALQAAHKVLRSEADIREGGADPSRATA
jgi:hypothetical protein